MKTAFTSEVVDIGTEWNLEGVVVHLIGDVACGRYRNRVEFRARKSASSSILIRVDIGTEWNLELIPPHAVIIPCFVDIGTEWNLETAAKPLKIPSAIVDIGTEWNLEDKEPVFISRTRISEF